MGTQPGVQKAALMTGASRGPQVCCVPSLFFMRGPGSSSSHTLTIVHCPCGHTSLRAVPALRPGWLGLQIPPVSHPYPLTGWHISGAESAVTCKGFLNSTLRVSVHVPSTLHQQGDSAQRVSLLQWDVVTGCFFSCVSQAENK